MRAFKIKVHLRACRRVREEIDRATDKVRVWFVYNSTVSIILEKVPAKGAMV
jgi:hypothetical protein